MVYIKRVPKINDATWKEAEVCLWSYVSCLLYRLLWMLMLCSAVEVNIAILCNSVVALRPLLSLFAKASFSSHSYSLYTKNSRNFTTIKQTIRNSLSRNASHRLQSMDNASSTMEACIDKKMGITKTTMLEMDVFDDSRESGDVRTGTLGTESSRRGGTRS